MKNTFSQSMAWLHTWGGLLFGWILFAIFLTGSLSVFDREITHWMQPEISHTVAVTEAVNHAADYLQTNAPDSPSWMIVPPTDRNPGTTVFWQEGSEFEHAVLNPATGTKTPRQTDGGHFFVHFHFELLSGVIGRWIVGAVGMMMLIGLLTGIVIHKRIFKDFFTFRPGSGAQRSWLDAHNALGVLTLPFLVVITFSGLAIFAYMYFAGPIQLLYGGSTEDREEFFHEVRPHVHLDPVGEWAKLLSLGGFAERAEGKADEGGVRLVIQNLTALDEAVLRAQRGEFHIYLNGNDETDELEKLISEAKSKSQTQGVQIKLYPAISNSERVEMSLPDIYLISPTTRAYLEALGSVEKVVEI